MIEVSGLQQQKEAGDPRSARRFAFDSAEQLSKLPIYIAMLLTGIAVYFKSAIPARAEASVEPASEPGPSASESGGAPIDFGRATAVRPDAVSSVEENRERPERLEPLDFFSQAPTRGNVVDFPSPMKLMKVGNPFGLDTLPLIEAATPSFGLNSGPAPTPTQSNKGGGGAAAQPEDGPDDQTPDPDNDDEDPEEPRRDNRAPSVAGQNRLNDVMMAQVVLFGLSELLMNTEDADGDELTVRDVRVSSGTVVAHDAFWVYTPEPDYLGEVRVTYSVSDGLETVAHSASFNVVEEGAVVPSGSGTIGHDWLVGSAIADIFDGLAGNDIIESRGGDDVIRGGDGNDTIRAGDGNDIVFAGRGNDEVSAGAGDDEVHGEEGDDRISCGSGDDLARGDDGRDIVQGDEGDDNLCGGTDGDMLSGGEGDDTVDGDEGDDTIYGDAGNDIVDGGDGDDSLFAGEGSDIVAGGDGSDYVEGEDGDDVIDAGAGADTVFAGGGNDLIIVTLDADGDVYDGGDGTDALDMSQASSGVSVDLVNGTVSSAEIGADIVSGFEKIIGGSGDDTFLVGGQSTAFVGAGGDDTFTFAMAASSGIGAGELVHEIIDFMVGDRVMVEQFEISGTARDAAEDLFSRVYDGQSNGGSAVPIRIRYERFDDMDHTIIDVDFDLNNEFEMSIDIYGHHTPYVYNTVA